MAPSYDTITLAKIKLSQLLQSGDLCDLIVKVHYSQCTKQNLTANFRAHKLILIASTPYFHSLYAKDQLNDVVTLPPSVEPLIFSVLLDFMYLKPISLCSIKAKIDDDPTYVHKHLPVTLKKLVIASYLLGLSTLAMQFTTWLNNISYAPLAVIKQESDGSSVVKLDAEERATSVATHLPVDDSEKIKNEDLNSVQYCPDIISSKLVVSIARVKTESITNNLSLVIFHDRFIRPIIFPLLLIFSYSHIVMPSSGAKRDSGG